MLARVVTRVVQRPLTTGNKIQPLVNGDEAFPAMLAAIESAQKSVSLSTYIFDNDASGQQFVEALGRAVSRGVAVRVLIDAAGARYSWPPVTHKLRHAGVNTVAHFCRRLCYAVARGYHQSPQPPQVARRGRQNRLHRRHEHPPRQRARRQTETAPCRTCSSASKARWSPSCRKPLPTIGRLPPAKFSTATSGFPNLSSCRQRHRPRHHGRAGRAILKSCAGRCWPRWPRRKRPCKFSRRIFCRTRRSITALNLAALRGVRVDIILPVKNNLPFVHWASRAMWWQVLEHGCRLWLTPPPFDHSKLMIVDGHWVLLGSANWDARSLRLNFELNVECYGRDLAHDLAAVIEKKLRGAREVTLAEVDGRPLPAKLRDATARLFSPYL